ncbi:MAG: hypothetical protein ACLUKK_07315 [Lacrimispora saccharolytica]
MKSSKRNMEKYKALHLEISKRLKKAKELEALFSKHERLTGSEMQNSNENKIEAYETIVKLLKRRIRTTWLKSSLRYSTRVVNGASVGKATLRREKR